MTESHTLTVEVQYPVSRFFPPLKCDTDFNKPSKIIGDLACIFLCLSTFPLYRELFFLWKVLLLCHVSVCSLAEYNHYDERIKKEISST